MAGKRPNITDMQEMSLASDESGVIFDVTGVDDAVLQFVLQPSADATSFVGAVEACLSYPGVPDVFVALPTPVAISASDVTGSVLKVLSGLSYNKLKVHQTTAGTSGKAWVLLHQNWSAV